MPIPKPEQAFIKEQLAGLAGPVKIDYFHQTDSAVLVPGRTPCPTCGPVKEALEEIAALSDQVTLTVYEFHEEADLARRRGIDRVPGIVVRGEVNRPLRFIGLPGGVFLPLLLRMILGAAAKPEPAPELTQALKKLRQKVHLRVFGALMHPPSGDAAFAAFLLALASPKVEATAYSVDEFPALAADLGLDRVPATIVGDSMGFAGVAPPQELARFLFDVQAHPDRANLQPPQVLPGSHTPWRPPASPSAGPGRPPAGRRPGRPPAPAPPGMRRTRSGLIIPGR